MLCTGTICTLDGKSLYNLDPNGFTDLNISEVILVKEKKNGLWNYNLPAVLTDEQCEPCIYREIINMFTYFMQKLL
jgi:hypothetical protein